MQPRFEEDPSQIRPQFEEEQDFVWRNNEYDQMEDFADYNTEVQPQSSVQQQRMNEEIQPQTVEQDQVDPDDLEDYRDYDW